MEQERDRRQDKRPEQAQGKGQRLGMRRLQDQDPDQEQDNRYQSDMIIGRNPVLEAMRAKRPINKIFIARGEREGSIKVVEAMAKDLGVVVQQVDRAKLDGMTGGGSHQGVIAMAAVREYVEVEDILDYAAERGEDPFLIILDEIEDPHNLGSIIRSVEAVGAHGVIIPKRRAVGLTPIVAKASSGAVEHIRIARVPNIVETIRTLKKRNIWVVGSDSGEGALVYTKADMKGSIALVIGGEGSGMSRLTRERCDFVVNIPMLGKVNSLNAAAAAAVILFEIRRQRG